ncbi:MAG: uroporphyrinogen-III C-methyltransferase [Thermoflavifilum sp.]|nr:uroporphyrinogen-III C-methyltransferase [Thermoflavifilum sp.]
MTSPKLTLIGAGPGDPELITLKGIKALQAGQVILYDALIDNRLLQYASPDALKIFVGKRKGYKAYSQEEIHELIVHYAKHFGHVVRLKGGDPFVFGRGYEELIYAQQHGVEVEVIPGISSAIAVPELQHIPVTLRGISESCWITTGTLADGQLSKDLQLAAHSSATIVVLMGVHKLPEIVALYHHLKKAQTPIAIIQNGSLIDEKIVVGTLENIQEKAAAAHIQPPAILVIGEVVRRHPLFSHKSTVACVE